MTNYITRIFVICVFVLGYAYSNYLPCYADDSETAVVSVAENSVEEDLIDVNFDMESNNATLVTQELPVIEESDGVSSSSEEKETSFVAKVFKIILFIVLMFVALAVASFFAFVSGIFFALQGEKYKNRETRELFSSIAACVLIIVWITSICYFSVSIWHFMNF